MAKLINIEYTKTYASIKNAEQAVKKVLKGDGNHANDDLRYIINPVIVEGAVRYGVLFIGNKAFEAQIHFHFNVIN